jgi:predicted transglutaminase-like cysteine proteinase
VLAGLLSLVVLVVAPQSTAPQSLSDVVQAVKSVEQGDGLFGSAEIRSDSLRGLPQWNRVLGAMKVAGRGFHDCAASEAQCTTPVLIKWRGIIVAAAKLSQRQQLKAVNDFFNRWPYKLDRELYGVTEYWATPKEFMSRSGDCEDYAIAKYFALRELGFSSDMLRIVALRDRIRGVGHAILSVELDDDFLILDSLSNLILSHTRYTHYVPQVSMNETTRWAHVGSAGKHEADVFKRKVPRK